jgi:hypothetical protein
MVEGRLCLPSLILKNEVFPAELNVTSPNGPFLLILRSPKVTPNVIAKIGSFSELLAPPSNEMDSGLQIMHFVKAMLVTTPPSLGVEVRRVPPVLQTAQEQPLMHSKRIALINGSTQNLLSGVIGG